MAEVNSNKDRELADKVVTLARGWIGTPYRHQASSQGAGTDCLGLLLGKWRELIGGLPEAIPPYSADWAEVGETEDLLEAAKRNLRWVEFADRAPGDVLVMRMRRGGIAKHVGILAWSEDGYSTLVHAYSGHGVVESPLTPAWSARVAGVFRFPVRSN